MHTLRMKWNGSCGFSMFASRDFLVIDSDDGGPIFPEWIATYPNPASDMLNIEIDHESIVQAKKLEQAVTDAKTIDIVPTYNLRLYDSQGNLLRQAAVKGGAVQFNVANLPNGVYYLHIYDGVNDTPAMRQIMIER